MRVNLKIGLTVLGFAFFVVLIIVGSFFVIGSNWRSLNIGQSIGSAVYVINMEEKAAIQQNEVVELRTDEMVSTQALDDLYFTGIIKYLPMIILIACFAIFILAMTMWFVLRRIYRKQMVGIIHDLQFLEKFSEDEVEDKTVAQAFKQLKSKLDSNLEDYKRLSSYLTHEQKNAIAVLRTNLELEQKESGDIHLLDRLTDSIDDILTLSTNTEETMSEQVDVSLVCAEVCDTYHKSYPALNFSFREDDSTVILGKKRWIYRAVSNLVDNAIKYGEQKPITVSVANQKGSIVVQIEDHGNGIDSKVHSTIFNHNYRMNGLKQDGYGIGLSVVSHVCDLCQGFVYVDSKKNQGSTFYLSFPEFLES